jgi:hypothetical protein
MSFVRIAPGLIGLTAAFLVISGAAIAQGWGEQGAVQFRYSNQGLSNEVYRNQFGIAAAAAAAVAGGGGLGGGGTGSAQGNNQLSNVVQINNNSTYNVSVTGDGNFLTFDNNVDAEQTSTDSNQTNSNVVNRISGGVQGGSSEILNK